MLRPDRPPGTAQAAVQALRHKRPSDCGNCRRAMRPDRPQRRRDPLLSVGFSNLPVSAFALLLLTVGRWRRVLRPPRHHAWRRPTGPTPAARNGPCVHDSSPALETFTHPDPAPGDRPRSSADPRTGLGTGPLVLRYAPLAAGLRNARESALGRLGEIRSARRSASEPPS